MIKAINKQGTVSYFRETVWDLMSPGRNGYIEMSDNNSPINIPDKITEFQATKKAQKEEKPEITQKQSVGDANATMEIMKEFLESKGVRVHPNIGYDKLKAKYDANH